MQADDVKRKGRLAINISHACQASSVEQVQKPAEYDLYVMGLQAQLNEYHFIRCCPCKSVDDGQCNTTNCCISGKPYTPRVSWDQKIVIEKS